MICANCQKQISKKPNSIQKKRNVRFYCDRKCYLEYVRKPTMHNCDFFDLIDNEEKAYWLGFICADGCMNDKSNTLQIVLQQGDHAHLKKLGNLLGVRVYKYEHFNSYHNKSFKTSSLRVGNNNIWRDLLSVGVLPRKSKIQSFGTNIMNKIKTELRSHFIRGYFDGDGSVCESVANEIKSNFTVGFSGQRGMMKVIKEELMKQLGVSNVDVEKADGCFIVRWSGREQVSIIGKWLYDGASVFLERKHKRFEAINKGIKSRGVSRYRGVTWHKPNKKWLANISHKKKRINLGYFESEIDAAQAYDGAVVEYDKPLYKLNFGVNSGR